MGESKDTSIEEYREIDTTLFKLIDRWERARRNPRYLSMAERVVFDENGFWDLIRTHEKIGDIKPFLRFPYEFGLLDMIDPQKEAHELFGFQRLLTKEEFSRYEEAYLRGEDLEDDFPKGMEIYESINKIFVPNWFAVSNDMNPPSSRPRKSPDGCYALFEIDITRSDREIVSELTFELARIRELTGKKTSKSGETFRKRFNYYKIWDKRKERAPFSDIALSHKVNREEPLEKAIARVKKQFYKACEFIMGKKYDSNEWRKLLFPDGTSPQRELITKGGAIEYGIESALDGDPEVRMLLKDINNICEKCKSDPKCRDAFLTGNLEAWNACPDIYAFLTE